MAIETTLLDDGTLDTVIEYHCTDCGDTWAERFTDSADYRDDETGELDITAFMEDQDIECFCEG